jgi:hypothetical protein
LVIDLDPATMIRVSRDVYSGNKLAFYDEDLRMVIGSYHTEFKEKLSTIKRIGWYCQIDEKEIVHEITDPCFCPVPPRRMQ